VHKLSIHLQNESKLRRFEMTAPFAWFDNIGTDRSRTTEFLSKTVDWASNDIGPMTFLTKGEAMPFAATCDAMPGISGWVPYVEVDALPEAVARAEANGAVIVAENLKGPAGVATFITDPGGAPLALWKRAAGM
jgi:predicted enzyme related to lactoylglutathione lyase